MEEIIIPKLKLIIESIEANRSSEVRHKYHVLYADAEGVINSLPIMTLDDGTDLLYTHFYERVRNTLLLYNDSNEGEIDIKYISVEWTQISDKLIKGITESLTIGNQRYLRLDTKTKWNCAFMAIHVAKRIG